MSFELFSVLLSRFYSLFPGTLYSSPRSVRLAPLGYSPMLDPTLPTLACFYCCWKPTRKPKELSRELGLRLWRLAERRFVPVLFQEPPRLTRLEPVASSCTQIFYSYCCRFDRLERLLNPSRHWCLACNSRSSTQPSFACHSRLRIFRKKRTLARLSGTMRKG